MDNPVVVLGAGVAGLYVALKLHPLPVMVISPSFSGDNGSSYLAQGGIAAAVGGDDAPELHLQDTINAGAGLVDESIASKIIYAAPSCIRDLEALGVAFDKDASGRYSLAKEAAHSRARVLHLNGDRSGAQLMCSLRQAVMSASNITVRDGLSAVSLAAENNTVYGVWLLDGDHTLNYQSARAVILATGGLAGLYRLTTNPPYILGQGLGMAARAGAEVMDCEFVQFHPTALATEDDPIPLVTEALRGAGALLVTQSGERFLKKVHQEQELAPRDVVARAIDHQLRCGQKVYLDARQYPGERFAEDFPQVYGACMKAKIDPLQGLIPIIPAAHYHIGGVATDAHGKTSLSRLYATGEVACTGMHGANRLASNSLLEGLVMADPVARHVKEIDPQPVRQTAMPPQYAPSATAEAWNTIRKTATRHIGIVRNESGLKQAQKIIGRLMEAHRSDLRFTNSCLALLAVATAALERRESRGCHFREDCHNSDVLEACHSKLIWSGWEYEQSGGLSTRKRHAYV